ncbi:MAG: ABC transporter permease subunit [Acidobacteria bacterium]|nr:ABC transporter permease subunit [Acidobacteriota bacterium]
MPIHDLGYRHWKGEWTSHPYRWWVITRQGIQLLMKRRRFLVLMILSAIPFVVRGAMIYFATVVGASAPFLKINARFFEDFISQQMFFAFFIAIYAGAGLISNDLRANALQIYFSKPITRRDYVIGKLGVLVWFLSLPTLVPGLILFLLAVLFAPDTAFLREHYWVPVSVTAYSLVMVLTFALVILTLSSLTRSSRFAGINFAAVFFFSQILYGILSGILRSRRVAWVSLGNNIEQLGDTIFRIDPRYPSPVWISVVVVLVIIGGGAWVVHNRVQAVEVVR